MARLDDSKEAVVSSIGATEVSKAQTTDHRTIAVTLARAFQYDPLLVFAMPDPVRRARALMRIMVPELSHARQHGEIWIARRERRLLGAAAWFAPGTYKRGPFDETLNMIRLSPNAVATGARSLRMMHLFSQVEAAHPTEDHWYLRILGVDPLSQRSGLGGALLGPGIVPCDSEGLPAYLETQNSENLGWYERFGFEVQREISVDRCPPVWTMRRAPR